jgi:hypothetical protein
MGSIVSQIKFWKNPSSVNGVNGGKTPGALSYDWYLAFAVLGGFLGLDHLYLRSPSTAILKFFVNIFFYGAWWLFDALNAFFNKDVIKVFGVGIPGFGPYGIGAGCLSEDKEDPTHLNFFSYSFGLGFGGLFGLDSLLVGNYIGAAIRFICLISIIGSPIAFLAWFYNIGRWLFYTPEVIQEFGGYFGTGITTPTFFSALPAVIGTPLDGINGSLSKLVSTASTVVDSLVSLPSDVSNIVKPFDTLLQGAQGIGASAPCAKDAIKAQQSQMKGGMSDSIPDSMLSYMLIGTIGMIAVSGIFSSYIRSNKSKEKSDSPPEPI